MQFALLSTSSLLSTCSILRSIIQGGCENASLFHIRDLLRSDGVPNTDPGGSTYNGIDTDGISLEVQSVIASLEQLELHIDFAVERFGKQCANPGSFMGALLAIGTSHARMADGVEYGYVGARRGAIALELTSSVHAWELHMGATMIVIQLPQRKAEEVESYSIVCYSIH